MLGHWCWVSVAGSTLLGHCLRVTLVSHCWVIAAGSVPQGHSCLVCAGPLVPRQVRWVALVWSVLRPCRWVSMIGSFSLRVQGHCCCMLMDKALAPHTCRLTPLVRHLAPAQKEWLKQRKYFKFSDPNLSFPGELSHFHWTFLDKIGRSNSSRTPPMQIGRILMFESKARRE